MARINYEKEQKEYGLSVANIQHAQSSFGAILNGYLYQLPSELGNDPAILHTRVKQNGTLDVMHTYADPNKKYGEMEWTFIDAKLGLRGKSLDASYIARVMENYGEEQKDLILETAQQKLIEENPAQDIRMAKYYHDLIQLAKNSELTNSEPERV